ncbi:hypothetical protein AAMO2058_000130300 [Amorphochlora amoebiformis]
MLVQTARDLGIPSAKMDTPALAHALDANDSFARFRKQFFIPKTSDRKGVDPEFGEAAGYSIYFCGNSLGLLSRRTERLMNEEIAKWKARGVEGHFTGKRPWAEIDEEVTAKLVDIVGSKSSAEIAVMNSLSMNIHTLLISFYQPTSKRYRIIMEEAAFCSDHHVIRSQVRLRGLKVDDVVRQLKPRPNEDTLRTEDILKAIEDEGDTLALLWIGGLQYYTGQFYDIKAITAKAHDQGALAGFDLAHAVGNVVLELHDWQVDFAAWCTYKYLNAGPGSIGGIFVHERHHNNKGLPILAGWWGQTPKTRFQMAHEWKGLAGAQAWQVSNPAVMPTVCLLGSLQLFEEAGGMRAIRKKSLLLTGLLEHLIDKRIPGDKARIITPRDPERRGCQLSILVSVPVKQVEKALSAGGIIVDVREPDVVRVAPCPLYNTFFEVYRFVEIFEEALQFKSKL